MDYSKDPKFEDIIVDKPVPRLWVSPMFHSLLTIATRSVSMQFLNSMSISRFPSSLSMSQLSSSMVQFCHPYPCLLSPSRTPTPPPPKMKVGNLSHNLQNFPFFIFICCIAYCVLYEHLSQISPHFLAASSSCVITCP